MNVVIVGTGKLASELLNEMQLGADFVVARWHSGMPAAARAIVVHAGSGRELPEAIAYCQQNDSVLIELATGSALETQAPGIPVILCPNTNLLMLKFMSMLARSGDLFKGYDIQLTESHQAGKKSTPGTAVAIAQSLGLAAEKIVSIRDPDEQGQALQIPEEHLARHAFHRISMQDSVCRIAMETRVYGNSPYAPGVSKIIEAVHAHALENRRYAISEFIENAWV